MDGQKCVQHSNHWNCGFMHFWSFCWLVENVIIHWSTMGELNMTPFSCSRPQRQFICMDMENVVFYNVFLQCFMLFWNCSISASCISARINLTFVRVEKWEIYIFDGWPNMCATFKPLEVRFHAFLVVLLITRKCHNSLEHHGRTEHDTFFIFTSTRQFICMDIENVVFTLCFTVFYALLWTCSISPSFNVSADKLDVAISASTKQHPQGFNNSQSNAVHMTLLIPPTPPRPLLWTTTKLAT